MVVGRRSLRDIFSQDVRGLSIMVVTMLMRRTITMAMRMRMRSDDAAA